MSFFNTMYGNFRKNILKNKIDINSIDNEINGSDVSIVKSPFDSFPKTKLSNINNEINNKSNEINSLILSTIEPKYKPYVIKRQRRSSINEGVGFCTREDKQIRSGTSSQTDARSTTARGY